MWHALAFYLDRIPFAISPCSCLSSASLKYQKRDVWERPEDHQWCFRDDFKWSVMLLLTISVFLFLQKETEDDTLTSKKVRELSVIDGRRAQNCNILLSKWVCSLDTHNATVSLFLDVRRLMGTDTIFHRLGFVHSNKVFCMTSLYNNSLFT